MAELELAYERRDAVAWLTIAREEKRNALSPETIAQFLAALDRAEADAAVRVVCITGAGDRAFCSGADLSAAFGQADPLAGPRAYAALLKRLATFPRPCVARVAGHCLAGGLGLLLSCDLAYARAGTKFGTPELGVGLFPMMIGALVFRHVERRRALEMIYTGRTYSAEEAEAMGLVTRACPEDRFEATVGEALAAVAAQAPVAMRIGRQALARVDGLELPAALDHLCDRLGDVLATEDALEGMMAFVQKRKPEWKGR